MLRRPATAADQPPPINSLAEQVDFSLGRYNPAYVRQLTQRPGGRRFFVVPGFPVHTEIPPARCLPRRLRAKRGELVAQQLRRERQPIACVLTMSPKGGRTGSYEGERCTRFRDLTKYEVLSSNVLESPEQAGILPDGIATVRVHFSRARTVQVPVVENFYLYKVDPAQRKKLMRQLRGLFQRLNDRPRRGTRAQRRRTQRRLYVRIERVIRAFTPTHIELLAADGRVVKVVKRGPNSDDLLGLGGPLR